MTKRTETLDEFAARLHDEAYEVRMEPVAPGRPHKPITYLKVQIGDEGVFFRSGPLPEGGHSYNYAEDHFEIGVSVYPTPCATSLAGLAGDRDWYFGRGRVIGIGSDSEPIIEPIGPWEKIGASENEAMENYWKLMTSK